MPWVRIHDAALTHPKIVGLSDRAFRLWVWGLSYAQQHLTDGFLPQPALPTGMKRAVVALTTQGLWTALDRSVGFQIHDYLDWNDSRETIQTKRDGARNALHRHRLKCISSVTSERPLARSGVGTRSEEEERSKEEKKPPTSVSVAATIPPRTHHDGSGRTIASAPDERDAERAGRLLERYAALFVKHRRGARYHNRMHLDFQRALELVQTWDDDAHLDKLATIVLTTDDDWIARTDRGFGVFAARATWADDRLREAQAS